MSKRYYKVPELESPVGDLITALPIHDPVAVYYRQSTEAQIGNISTSIQTVDMVSYLKNHGWREADIYMIDMDAGVSGTKKIDERPGMKRLFELITEQKIRAVACQDEDRLFRDVTQIQVNIFIEACRVSNVLVITPSMVYDFANPLTGTFHARQFRFKCEMAAEYINSIILGKLARAKKRIHLEGRWVGSHVAVGYMVDKRKTLPEGGENPSWRKYVPFPPYAEIVQEYFRLFLHYNGNLRRTVRHIQRFGPYYPDPNTTTPSEGFFVKYRMNINGNGYCPSVTGMKDMLMNAVYAGHWSVKGVIRIFDNHEPIIDADIFMRAFNYMSEFTLDGRPNGDFRPIRQNTRPSLDEKRTAERPLCLGLMVALENGAWHNVGTEWQRRDNAYRYCFRSTYSMSKDSLLWTKVASHVDDVITSLVHQKLATTFNSASWEETISQSAQIYQNERRRIEKQLAALEQVMQKQIVSLDTLTNVDMIHAIEKRYEDAQEEHSRLSQALYKAEDEGSKLEMLSALKRDFSLVLEQWDSYSFEQKQGILHMLITRIEATPNESHDLALVVYWLDGSVDHTVVEYRTAKGTTWRRRETERLLELLDAGATQIEIAREFPERNWGDIYKHLYFLRGSAAHVFSALPIKYKESYTMYLERIAQNPTIHRARGGTVWIEKDKALLLELLDGGASRIELAEAFPARTWRAIREEVVRLRGKNIPIAGERTIRVTETIEMYRIRIGASNGVSEEERTGNSDETSSDALSL